MQVARDCSCGTSRACSFEDATSCPVILCRDLPLPPPSSSASQALRALMRRIIPCRSGSALPRLSATMRQHSPIGLMRPTAFTSSRRSTRLPAVIPHPVVNSVAHALLRIDPARPVAGDRDPGTGWLPAGGIAWYVGSVTNQASSGSRLIVLPISSRGHNSISGTVGVMRRSRTRLPGAQKSAHNCNTTTYMQGVSRPAGPRPPAASGE